MNYRETMVPGVTYLPGVPPTVNKYWRQILAGTAGGNIAGPRCHHLQKDSIFIFQKFHSKILGAASPLENGKYDVI